MLPSHPQSPVRTLTSSARTGRKMMIRGCILTQQKLGEEKATTTVISSTASTGGTFSRSAAARRSTQWPRLLRRQEAEHLFTPSLLPPATPEPGPRGRGPGLAKSDVLFAYRLTEVQRSRSAAKVCSSASLCFPSCLYSRLHRPRAPNPGSFPIIPMWFSQ